MKKYYLSLLMAIMAIAVSAQEPWDGTSASWTNGDGSSEKPYLIENGHFLSSRPYSVQPPLRSYPEPWQNVLNFLLIVFTAS